MTKVADLGTAKAEFARYIADKSRYVSITEQEGPLRHGEQRLLSRRRWYIKQTMQWDIERLCWKSKDGRPLVTMDRIWDTVICEMRQLHTHGQKLVWTTIKAKFDGILEDDVRMICKIWYNHGLSQLDRHNESQWSQPDNSLQEMEPLPDDDAPQVDESPQVEEPSRNDVPSQEDEAPQVDESPQVEEPSRNDVPSQKDEAPQVDEFPQDKEPSRNDVSSQEDEVPQVDEPSRANNSLRDGALLRDKYPGHQSLKCVLIPQKHPIINTNTPKRRRRANSTEMLQRYNERLEKERDARWSSRQAKKDIDGLRGIGGGIYASNTKTFAQEAAERMARSNALADFVDNASPVAPKGRQGTTTKKRLRSRSTSSPPNGDEGDEGDKDDCDNDDDDEDDDDDGDWERVRPDPELLAKHERIATAYGEPVKGQQASYGPLYA